MFLSACITAYVWIEVISLLQIKGEVKSVLEFINYVYGIFGFNYELELSTVIIQTYLYFGSIYKLFETLDII